MMAYIERKVRAGGLGGTSFVHEVLVHRDGQGRRHRIFLRKGWRNMPELQVFGAELMLRRLVKGLRKGGNGNGKVGRPSALPDGIDPELKAMGYKRKGSRLIMDLKSYFTIGCAKARLTLMSQACREVIGSAAALLELELKARSLVKSANRRGVNGLRFEEALEMAIAEQPSRL